MATPFMNLDLPVVTVTPGPEWASRLNEALSLIDQHDHSEGRGTKITPAGLNINADLDFLENNANRLRSIRMINSPLPLAEINDLRSLYVSGGNLYYNNESGTPVQITSGAGLNASSLGGIGGDYGTSDASVFYTDINKTFSFWQDANIPAHIDAGNVILREAVTSPNGVTLRSPTSLGSSYNFTFPTGLPAGGETKILTIDSSGQVGAQYDVDGETIEVSGNTIRVKDAGIKTPKIENLAVTEEKIGDGAVTTNKIPSAALVSDHFPDYEISPVKLKPPFIKLSGIAAGVADTPFIVTSTEFVDIPDLSIDLSSDIPNLVSKRKYCVDFAEYFLKQSPLDPVNEKLWGRITINSGATMCLRLVFDTASHPETFISLGQWTWGGASTNMTVSPSIFKWVGTYAPEDELPSALPDDVRTIKAQVAKMSAAGGSIVIQGMGMRIYEV